MPLAKAAKRFGEPAQICTGTITSDLVDKGMCEAWTKMEQNFIKELWGKS